MWLLCRDSQRIPTNRSEILVFSRFRCLRDGIGLLRIPISGERVCMSIVLSFIESSLSGWLGRLLRIDLRPRGLRLFEEMFSFSTLENFFRLLPKASA